MQTSGGAINWPKDRTSQIVLFGVGLVGIILIYFGTVFLPSSVDWHYFHRPATLKLLQGQSPYDIFGFMNPPWALIPLIPFAVLPEQVGRTLLVVVAMAVILYAGYQFGGRRFALVALLVSPPVIALIFYGNIDWIVVLGLVLPPQIGMLLVTTKPQVGVFVVFVWLVQGWVDGGWRRAAHLVSPLLLVTLISFLLYGFWPVHFLDYQLFEGNLFLNYSLWPYSIPIGLVLLFLGYKFRRIEFGLGASPCLSPYVLMQSWVGAFLAIIRYELLLVIVVVCVWAYLLQ